MGLLAWTLCVLTVGVLIVTNQPKTVAGETNLSCILDVAVIVDMAITDDQGKAAALQEFIQQFSDLIGVSEDGSHIGVMNVDATANTLLSLTEGLSIEAVANAFAGMQSGESRTGDLSLNLSSAIKKAYEEILSTSNNRQEVPDAVLVITDGSTSISSTLDNAVSSAVSIVVVGVGPTADSSALSSIASSGSFFAVSVSANWSAIAGDVEAALCNECEEYKEKLEDCLEDLEECQTELEDLKDATYPIIFGRSYKSLCETKETESFVFRKTDEGFVCHWFWRQRCACMVDRGNGNVTLCDENDTACLPCSKEPCLGLGLSGDRYHFEIRPKEECLEEICGDSNEEQDDERRKRTATCSYSRDCLFDDSCCEGYLELCVDPAAVTSTSGGFPTCYSYDEGCCEKGGCCDGTACAFAYAL